MDGPALKARRAKLLRRAAGCSAFALLCVVLTALQVVFGRERPVPWYLPQAWWEWFWAAPNDHAVALITAAVGACSLGIGVFQLFMSAALRETEERIKQEGRKNTKQIIYRGDDNTAQVLKAGDDNADKIIAAIEARVPNAERQAFQARIGALETEHNLSFPLIRSLLVSLGEAENIPDNQLLVEFEKQVKAVAPLVEEARRPSNVPEIAAARAAIAAALNKGDRDAADSAYERAAEALAETRKAASLEEAEMYLGRAKIALSRLDRLTAADHFHSAGTLAEPFDKEFAFKAWSDEATALFDYGSLFPGLEALRRSADIWRALVEKSHNPVQQAGAAAAWGFMLQQLGDRAAGAEGLDALNKASKAFEVAIIIFTEADMAAGRAMAQVGLGCALQGLAARADAPTGLTALHQAAGAFEAALGVFAKVNMRENWAEAQVNLGNVLAILGDRVMGEAGPGFLNRAVQAYEAALTTFTETETPYLWAATQNNLGNALLSLGNRADKATGLQILNRAVKAYEAALKVQTETETPTDWARTQKNLGSALHGLSERADKATALEMLGRSIQAYDAALRVRTEFEMPYDWARTQSGLGQSLTAFGERTDGTAGADALKRAVQILNASLKVCIEADMPADWAMTQNNLGNALLILGARASGATGVENLNQAVEAFDAALRVYTEADLPADWVFTTENLAMAYESLSKIDGDVGRSDQALALMDRVIPMFQAMQASYNVEKAQRNRARMVMLRDRLGGRL